ncbi:MAG: hypothetical protein DYH12_06030 [Sorangiineae bacterium PRO1]|nr:hypothetical protein [Sorangiineae bacterium PRO1]
MRLTRLIVPLVLLGLYAGCGSSKSRPGDAYGTEDQFCKQWGKAACNSTVVSACAAASVDSCVEKQAAFCMGLVPPYYASKNAKSCIDKVKAAYADGKLTAAEKAVVRDAAAPCDKLNKGPKLAGETCDASDECDGLADLECVIKPGAPDGTCQVPKEVGGGFSCKAPDEVCAEGFYCDGSNCIAGKTSGETCSEDVACAPEFLCQGTLCLPKGDTAASCQSDAECKSGICAKPAVGPGKCVDSVVLTPTDPICQSLG